MSNVERKYLNVGFSVSDITAGMEVIRIINDGSYYCADCHSNSPKIIYKNLFYIDKNNLNVKCNNCTIDKASKLVEKNTRYISAYIKDT